VEFVDYYAALHLPKNAPIREVKKALDDFMENPNPDDFDVCIKAYKILSNPYKRARYNKTFGYLMVIEAGYQEYLNAVHYPLNSIQPYASLQSLIEKFKAWILVKYDFDWKEAQAANYSYHLKNTDENLWLVLRFPIASDLEKFSRLLVRQRLIKAPVG
jgi:curved DNA-binding protein CbpA